MRLFQTQFLVIFTALFLGFFGQSNAQMQKDLSRQIQIPEINNLNSSDTHLYVLSENEGLVVFRAHADSLQWLYSSTGMQQRGSILESDIRFAYLYGNGRRLTVIEPTSVLGVYSSTMLPARPLSAKRIGQQLFIAMGRSGLGTLSLETPESVDGEITMVESGSNVTDLETDGRRTLYALNGDNEILIFEVSDEQISNPQPVQINRSVSKLWLLDDELYGSDSSGRIFLINSDGNTRSVGQLSAELERMNKWNGMILARTVNGDVYTGPVNGELEIWRSGRQAGNFFTVSESNLWLTEFNGLAPVVIRESGESTRQTSSAMRLKPIENVTLPFPRPLLLPIEFESVTDPAQVALSYTASFNNARIRGNSFYWQPATGQTGRHSVTIIATSAGGETDSTSFTIDLRPFNSPPRFTAARPITIAVDESFELQINAIDPDGIDQNLIRYLGVDMPDGANINEQTGIFSWTPTIRQVGAHEFQVIATDQYGAAASQNFTINVIEIEDEEPFDDELY